MGRSRIAIIGAGSVGSTTAYAIMLKNIAAEIMLVDVNEVRCKGEVLDLADALPFYCTSTLSQAKPKDAGAADIIIIAAGARQKQGQTRAELIHSNHGIMSSIIKEMSPLNPEAIIIIISNPVDVLTQLVQNLSGLPRNQVFGSGTLLDSLRLCGLIKQKIGISEQSIQAFVLGEHGDTQFPAWSCSTIAGISLTQFPGITQQILDELAQEACQKAYTIIACKEATYFGVAACVASMCESVLFDQKRIMPLSTYIPEFDVCLSVPVVLGASGVEQVLLQVLSPAEREKLAISTAAVKGTGPLA